MLEANLLITKEKTIILGMVIVDQTVIHAT
jgi:hypothetical protein